MLSLLFFACGNEQPEANRKPEPVQDSILPEVVADEVSSRKKKVVSRENSEEDLKPARENFKRINSIEKWTTTKKKDLWETSEGGEADYCYLNGTLEKIVLRQFGETFQKITEFYLLEGEPSFVFEKEYKYNRPIYWDSTAMKENGDNEAWDSEKSEISETRNYFKQGTLIQQERGIDGGNPMPKTELPKEEKRLVNQFKTLFPEPAQ